MCGLASFGVSPCCSTLQNYFVVTWGQLPPGPASGVSNIFLNSDWSIRDTRDCQVFRYRFVYRNILSLGFQILAPGFCHVWCHDTPELVSLRFEFELSLPVFRARARAPCHVSELPSPPPGPRVAIELPVCDVYSNLPVPVYPRVCGMDGAGAPGGENRRCECSTSASPCCPGCPPQGRVMATAIRMSVPTFVLTMFLSHRRGEDSRNLESCENLSRAHPGEEDP